MEPMRPHWVQECVEKKGPITPYVPHMTMVKHIAISALIFYHRPQIPLTGAGNIEPGKKILVLTRINTPPSTRQIFIFFLFLFLSFILSPAFSPIHSFSLSSYPWPCECMLKSVGPATLS